MNSKPFIYSMIRVVCQGKIKACNFCKENENNGIAKEGYCSKCGRPLWKNPGETCSFIIGYIDRNYKQNGKVHIKCKNCNTITTI